MLSHKRDFASLAIKILATAKRRNEPNRKTAVRKYDKNIS